MDVLINNSIYFLIIGLNYNLKNLINLDKLFYIQILIYISTYIFHLIDNYDGLWTKYKLPIIRKTKVNFYDMIKVVIKNNIIGYIVFRYILLPLTSFRGALKTETTFFEYFIDFIKIYFIFDFLFYIFHRTLHNKLFYKYHKLHHSTYGDKAVSANYMHIVDYFLELVIPFWITISLINCSLITSFTFGIIGNLNGVITHSGYNIPFLPSSDMHKDHHVINNKYYGVGGPWDYLLGTN